MIVLVTYDITDDQRREDVAVLLSGYGPRVQLSVFECECRTTDELRDLRARLRDLIDPLEDQIRLYHNHHLRPALHPRSQNRRRTRRLRDRQMTTVPTPDARNDTAYKAATPVPSQGPTRTTASARRQRRPRCSQGPTVQVTDPRRHREAGTRSRSGHPRSRRSQAAILAQVRATRKR
ncbi:CRISPR-associated endonuclease Cas2 [Nocardia sp. NPDC004085]